LVTKYESKADGRAHGLASKTKLNGVWIARRNFEKPVDITISPILSSPGCAPSAGPFSFKDKGMHIIVESRITNPALASAF
jgi:hypothetical protein